eukprot:CAMPEP_0197451020 /NCGR_PEP_ID=MMETSP1175-20131217/27397_1 /TAXON_ID=1003142 /ORGANISM="Triceratium dubium, Strain CCMP147" /LENGTH=84 /DNA_ID=CAMNT_0042983617 /DNA_START=36 /DNA_END=287 /DNA_ORIENTATION=+
MVKYDDENDLATVNGDFTSSQLQAVLSEYIDTFILCSVCGDPGTRYGMKGGGGSKKKNPGLFLSCGACGAMTCIDCDEHRLGKW